MEKEDIVNHPKHYEKGCSIECIHMMWTILGFRGVIMFCMGNAYKYLWRHKLKGKPEEDLAKAKWYIDECFWMLEDLEHDDEEEYKWVLPKVCELLRLYSLYSTKNSAKLEDNDGDTIQTLLSKIDDYMTNENLENILNKYKEEIEHEDQEDWKKVYRLLDDFDSECACSFTAINSSLEICKKHCERDS